MTHDVSDDEIWNGLRRRFAAGERLISRPARPGETSKRLAKPARRPTRLRVAGAGSLVAVGAVIVLVAVVLGPGRGRPGVSSASNGTTGAIAVTSTDDALSLSARLDRASVEPGGKVTVEVTIHNGRPSPVVYDMACDSPTVMTTTMTLPLEPVGRAWTGLEGHLKAAMLSPGGLSGDSSDSIDTTTWSGSCSSGFQGERTLGPGETVDGTLVWSAELASGVSAMPGDVPFTITFDHDRLNGPPSYPPDYKGPIGGWVAMYRHLSVTGNIRIVGQSPQLLSKGQAIDAVLSEPKFASWLAEQPESTWSIANLMLGNFGETSIVPAGPNWELELFRETGVPRNFAMAFVDPFSGSVRLNFCEAPCSR
jgi:hypothetical protein